MLRPDLLIAAIGTWGDVAPYLALAERLERRGVSVTLATDRCHEGRIGARAFPVEYVTHTPAAAIDQMSLAAAEESNPVVKAQRFIHAWIAAARDDLDRALPPLARQSRCRFFSGLLHRWFYGVDGGPGVLGLHCPVESGELMALARGGPVLYGVSAALPRLGAFRPRGVEVTGFWVDDATGHAPPLPAELARFLDTGDGPCILITTGSLACFDAQRLGRVIGAAVVRAGVRAVCQGPWARWAAAVPGARLIEQKFVSYSVLMPRVDAVALHGGAGTAALAAWHGRPTVYMPMFPDQILMAQAMQAAGASAGWFAPSDAEAEEIAPLMELAATSRALRDGAAALAGALRLEGGLDSVSTSLYALVKKDLKF